MIFIKYNSKLLKFFPKWVDSFVFRQTIHVRGDKISETLLAHEYIHTRQYRKYGFVCFLVIYMFEYFLNLIKYRDSFKAYRSISFEKEAYSLQDTEKIHTEISGIEFKEK